MLKRLGRHFPIVCTLQPPRNTVLLFMILLTLGLTNTFVEALVSRVHSSSAFSLSQRIQPPRHLLRMASTSSVDSVSNKDGFPYRLIDSHHHVWTAGSLPYAYAEGQSAPPGLQEKGSVEEFLGLAANAGVQRSLIVQPILYMFDHSYVRAALERYPEKFHGMLVANPTLSPQEATAELGRLQSQGFNSVRFNPYIWPAGEKMDNPTGRALYAEAGRRTMPVGHMLFKGLHLHLPEVQALLHLSPQTRVVIDHWGFFHQQGNLVPEAWAALLSLAEYPQVHVKISAFFRISSQPWPFQDLAPRLEELVKVYGSERLMWGSDFPYVCTLGGGYKEAPRAILAWKAAGLLPSLTETDYENLFSGTYCRVFGVTGREG